MENQIIKKSLKEAISLKDKLDKISDKVGDIIYDILHSAYNYEEYESIDELKKQFILTENLSNNEFWFHFPFGNIDFEDLLKINKRFNEEGWEIKGIISMDIYKNKKGLEITFVKS